MNRIARHVGCEPSVSLCHGRLRGLNSPRHETPRPVILDGTCNVAHRRSGLPLRTAPFRRVYAFTLHGRLTGMFQALFTALPGYFSVFLRSTSSLSDSGNYLGLGGLYSRIRPEIPVRPTPFDGSACHAFAYGVVTLFCGPFQTASAIRGRAPRHHISGRFPVRIRLGLCPFHSPLLRASRLLSFPAGTLMLRLPAFAFRCTHPRTRPLGVAPLRPASGTIPGITRVYRVRKSHSEVPGS